MLTCCYCKFAVKFDGVPGYKPESLYCVKHLRDMNGLGCDDAWPKDADPRCDECRFWVERPDTEFPEGRCHHSTMQYENRIGTIIAGWYCENWRAR